ncbi:MAG: hypothetical protein ACKVX7_03295 [Planctomycetota bacterium]
MFEWEESSARVTRLLTIRAKSQSWRAGVPARDPLLLTKSAAQDTSLNAHIRNSWTEQGSTRRDAAGPSRLPLVTKFLQTVYESLLEQFRAGCAGKNFWKILARLRIEDTMGDFGRRSSSPDPLWSERWVNDQLNSAFEANSVYEAN